jgi:hypothetical protein
MFSAYAVRSFISYSFVMSILAVAAFSLLIPGSAGGFSVARADASPTVYYVASNGSDDAAGTEGAPFKTIQKAASLVSAGDTVVVRHGSYTGFQLG